MKKKKGLFLLCCLCLFYLAIPVFAVSSIAYVDDSSYLLSSPEKNALTEKAEQLSHAYQADVRILTVDTLGDSYADDYADWYYFSNGFQENGILLLLAMTEREWYIYTSGDVIDYISDSDISELSLEFTGFLTEGYYYHAFDSYLNALPYYLDEEEPGPNLLLSLIIGLLAGGVTVGIMYASMNTKRREGMASSYMQTNSFHLNTRQDLFLYSKIDKVRRQQNTNSAGKTTIHSGSTSGRHHGGGGGKF